MYLINIKQYYQFNVKWQYIQAVSSCSSCYLTCIAHDKHSQIFHPFQISRNFSVNLFITVAIKCSKIWLTILDIIYLCNISSHTLKQTYLIRWTFCCGEYITPTPDFHGLERFKHSVMIANYVEVTIINEHLEKTSKLSVKLDTMWLGNITAKHFLFYSLLQKAPCSLQAKVQEFLFLTAWNHSSWRQRQHLIVYQMVNLPHGLPS